MKAVAAVLLPVLLLTCSGCILIPTPEYRSDGHATRQNISSRDVEKLQVGVTTREQVLLRFGEPDATFDGQTRFVYLWARVVAWIAGGAGTRGDAGEISKGYTMEVQFNPDGTVCRREILTAGIGDLFRLQNIAGIGYAPLRTKERR